jgi:hypothetical protein
MESCPALHILAYYIPAIVNYGQAIHESGYA